MKRLFAIILFILSLGVHSHAQSLSSARQQKSKLEKEIKDIDKQLSSTSAKKTASINSLRLTQKKISSRKQLISELEKEISILDKNIDSKNLSIKKLEERLETLENHYNLLIINAYKNKDTKVWFMHIAGSEDIGQAIRRWQYLKRMNESISTQVEVIKSTQEQLIKEKAELEKYYSDSKRTQNERKNEYQKLIKEEQQFNSSVKSLQRQEKKIRDGLKRKQKEVETLNKRIEKLVAEEIKRQQAAEAKNNKKVNYALSGKFQNNKGKLPFPTRNGVIIERFGQSYHPVFKSLKMPFNNGIDISTSPNSSAYNVFDGVVKQIIVIPGYNLCVLVQHGEYFTFYCKLKEVKVKPEQSLKTGDLIGTIDNNEDGNTVLHFELWKGTSKQNPESWLKK